MSRFLRPVDVHLQLLPQEDNVTVEEYVEFLYEQKDKLLEWVKSGGADVEVSHVVVRPGRGGGAVLSLMRFETEGEGRERAQLDYQAKVQRREQYDELKLEFEEDEV